LQGNYSFKDLSYKAEDIPAFIPSAEFRTKIFWTIPQATILSYAMEVKIDKRGKGALDAVNAASILSVNKSLGFD